METSQRLKSILFEDASIGTYAILDGASIPDLLDQLEADRPEYLCLYRGELKEGLEVVAPYLVRLEPHHTFTRWLLAFGWGRHFGVFLHADVSLAARRLHLRRGLRVYTEDRDALYFRYYDPRVLRVFLPTTTPEEAGAFFGLIGTFLCESEDPTKCLHFAVRNGALRQQVRSLEGESDWEGIETGR